MDAHRLQRTSYFRACWRKRQSRPGLSLSCAQASGIEFSRLTAGRRLPHSRTFWQAQVPYPDLELLRGCSDAVTAMMKSTARSAHDKSLSSEESDEVKVSCPVRKRRWGG